MEPMKETVEFYKTSFNNSFNAMLMLQEQAQKMFDMQLGQLPGIPEEGKKAIKELVESYNKGCTEFKKIVDESFTRVDAYFATAEKA